MKRSLFALSVLVVVALVALPTAAEAKLKTKVFSTRPAKHPPIPSVAPDSVFPGRGFTYSSMRVKPPKRAKRVKDVNVDVRLNHTADRDLVLTILKPTTDFVGTRQAVLSSRIGGSGNNYGAGPNDCSGTFTVFDDEAAAPIGGGAPPFAGAFQAQFALLSDLNGPWVAGAWTLAITDFGVADTGTLGCWRVQITYSLKKK